MSALKLPLLLSAAWGFHASLWRPHEPDQEDKVAVPTTREAILGYIGPACKNYFRITIWMITLAESMVIVGSSQPTVREYEMVAAILDSLGPAEASKLTPSSVLGALLVVAGGMIRWECYRTLGRHFTFVLRIRKEHKLITSGPYSVVRHPGYTAIYMCLVGLYTMHGVPGSWLRDSGVLNVWWVRGMVVAWCVMMAGISITLFHRTRDEDRFLSEKFGEEWKAWARRVKYKLVPFVY